MLDPETFLTEVYVLADEFCKTVLPPACRGSPAAALDRSELLTLAIVSQWAQFPSERAFYRWAHQHWRAAFPTLPSRPQFNRQLRHAHDLLTAFALHLGRALAAPACAYEVLDGTGVRTRNAKRRGRGGLAGLADIGWCSRLGWYEGVRLLLGVTPYGVISGWGLGPASTNDRTLAEPFFAAGAVPQPRLRTVGQPVSDCYVADQGFSGQACQERWRTAYGAVVISVPQRGSKRAWPKSLRRWRAGRRQVIETVNAHLLTPFRLDQERPHALSGLQARLAAKIGRQNVCIWLNRQFGQPDLAFAEMIDS